MVEITPDPKPRKPIKEKRFLEWLVQERVCLFCGSQTVEAHHWRVGSGPGQGSMGRKPDDFRVLAVCRPCHNALHGTDSIRAKWMFEYIGFEDVYKSMIDNFCDWWWEING